LQDANAIYTKHQTQGARDVNAIEYKELDQAWQASYDQLLDQRAAFMAKELPNWISLEPPRQTAADIQSDVKTDTRDTVPATEQGVPATQPSS